jgi:hypothetical protein
VPLFVSPAILRRQPLIGGPRRLGRRQRPVDGRVPRANR